MDKEELTQKLAEKYKVSPEQVEKAWDSQFKFLSQVMKTEEKPEVRIPYFGIFKPDERRIKHIEKHNNNDKND